MKKKLGGLGFPLLLPLRFLFLAGDWLGSAEVVDVEARGDDEVERELSTGGGCGSVVVTGMEVLGGEDDEASDAAGAEGCDKEGSEAPSST